MQTTLLSRILEPKCGKSHSCFNNDQAGLTPEENPKVTISLLYCYNKTNLSKLVSCSDTTTHKNSAMANPHNLKIKIMYTYIIP